MRKGINKKNYNYWKNEVFIKLHNNPEEIADLKAHRICHEQEIERLINRIIKLEKKSSK